MLLIKYISCLVPPTHVTISGPSEARAGETVSFSCITAPSNPAADVRWTIDGRQKRNSTSKQEPSNEGGMVTSSNISFTIDSHKRSFSILCQGINLQLADNVMTTHTLYVLCKDSILFCNFDLFLNYLFLCFFFQNRSTFKTNHLRLR